MLLLEDLHWADTASLDLLRFLARTVSSLPILLVATYRGDELERRHPLAALIPLLVRESPAERIDLRPLDADAAHALVRVRYNLSGDESNLLANYLMERTEGNALFITELLRTLEEEGLLHEAAGRWHVGAIAQAPIPRLLKQIIDTRLKRLGDEADALLAVAAVIGQEVSLAVWEAVTQVDEEILAGLAERTEAAHLVAAWADGAGIRFTHALIRAVLYESVPTPRRRRLHRQVGDALAALPAPDPDAVAYHFQRAGDERAAAWLVRAGERAQDAHALVTAAARYEAAFALLDAWQRDATERGWLRLLAASLRGYEEPGRALAWVEEAVGLGAEGKDASLAARAQAMRGLLRCYRGEFRAGMADLAAATEAVEPLPPGTGVAHRGEQQIDKVANRGTLVAFLAYLGHLAEARERGERYLATAVAPLTPAAVGALADVYTGLSMAYALQGEPERSRRSFAAGIAAYEAIDHYMLAFTLQRAELIFGVLPYRADDLTEREHAVSRTAAAATRLIARGGRVHPDLPTYARVPLLVLEGHWPEARRFMELPDTSDLTIDARSRVFYLGTLARLQGDAETAWRCVRETWPDGPASEPGERAGSLPLLPVRLQLLAVALALDTGDLASARAWLDSHRRWLDFMGAALGRSEEEALEAEWCCASSDAPRARDHAAQAFSHATSPRQPLALLAAHRLLGILDTNAGEHGAAADHFAAALALADACRAPYERVLTLIAHAEFMATRNEPTRAQAMLDEARALCLPMDAHPALAQIAQVATRIADLANRPAPAPAGLSVREIEVLRLVAAGLGNAAIAERLFLSPRTVMAHVANIFAKINVTNRAAATRFAADHGLV